MISTEPAPNAPAAEPAPAAIRVRGLRKRYRRVTALDGLDLQVPRGAIYGFIGQNGAGKTSTIRVLATLLQPDAGEVEIDGVDVLRAPARARSRLGYVPDFFGVYDDLKAGEYLDFYAALHGVRAADAARLRDDLLALVDLADRRDEYVEHLSRGMQQRLCLARALIHDPQVLLLDEPASGLDPLGRVELREILKELGRMGKTILISSHILAELADLCSHVGIVAGGRMIREGSVAEVLQAAERPGFRLRVLRDADQAAALLAALPGVGPVETDDVDIRFYCVDGAEGAAVALAAVVAAGLPVARFAELESSLEATFVRLVRGEAAPVIARLLEVGAGLAAGVRGLVRKELHTRSRGWRPMWLLGGYLGVLALAVAGFLALVERTSGGLPPTIGTLLFSALAVASVLLLAFITPALTFGAISGERERRTLDLLLVSRASPLGLAGGKLLASLAYIVYLLAATLPAFALVYLYGGVPPRFLALVLLVATVTALDHAALGLLLSALLRRTVVAAVVSYLLVLVLMLAVPLAWLIIGRGQFQPFANITADTPRVLLPPGVGYYISPLLSLISLLTGLLLTSGSVGGGLVPAPTLPLTQAVYSLREPWVAGPDELVIAWAPWIYHLAFSAVFVLTSLLISALALSPRKPWRR